MNSVTVWLISQWDVLRRRNFRPQDFDPQYASWLTAVMDHSWSIFCMNWFAVGWAATIGRE